MSCDSPKCWGILAIVGLILLVLGVLIGFVAFPLVVKDQIAKQVRLSEGTEAYDRWEVVPVPLYFNAYIFNVKNPEDVQLRGAKPIVEEVGPFVYKEIRSKVNINLNVEEDTATYNQDIKFYFDPERSGNFTEDYEVTVLNIPKITLAYAASSLAIGSIDIDLILRQLNSALQKIWGNDDVFMKVRAGDLIFGKIPINCDFLPWEIVPNAVCKILRDQSPPSITPDEDGKTLQFSLFRYKNVSYDGVYKIKTGLEDVVQIGNIVSWNNLTTLDHWGGDSCNKIKGTDMTTFRPYLGEKGAENLYIYNTDLCRVLTLGYSQMETYQGITVRRYTALKGNLLKSVEEFPENYCYCPRSLDGLTKYGGCLRKGAMELTPCQKSPVILTYPHFFDADESYKDTVIGLEPDEEKHKLFVDLEPYTGTPVRAGARVQINFPLRPMPKVDMFKNLPNSLLPVIWFDETLNLSTKYIDMLNNQLLHIVLALNIVKWGLITIGILLIIVSSVFYIIVRKKVKRERRKLHESQHEIVQHESATREDDKKFY